MTKTIIDIYGMAPVKAWNSSKSPQLNAPSPHLLYGIELEIENTLDMVSTQGFRAVEDGSLRNNGMEFVSNPMTYSNAIFALNAFFDRNKAKATYNDDGSDAMDSNYSERTSIHVHINCQDLTMEQLATLCMIYETFERLLFGFIGYHRDKNIFCVPWYETNLSYQTVHYLSGGDTSKIRRWQKYTSLNLLPLQTKGTVEFRHMHGNSDREFIAQWLRIIGRMHAAAISMTFDELKNTLIALNTTSHYDRTMEMIFREEANLLRVDGYLMTLEQGVLDMKYSLVSNTTKAKKAMPTAQQLMDEANMDNAAALERVMAAQRQVRNPFAVPPRREIPPRPREAAAQQFFAGHPAAWGPQPAGIRVQAVDVPRWDQVRPGDMFVMDDVVQEGNL